VIPVECPECGERFAVGSDVVSLSNRFYCSVCDALLEVIEEDPVVLDVVDEGGLDDDEDVEQDEDWEDL